MKQVVGSCGHLRSARESTANATRVLTLGFVHAKACIADVIARRQTNRYQSFFRRNNSQKRQFLRAKQRHRKFSEERMENRRLRETIKRSFLNHQADEEEDFRSDDTSAYWILRMTWPTSWSPDLRDHLDQYPYLHQRLKQGRGLGSGARYKPWIFVRNVKDGDGRTTHVRGITTGRVHHVLSRHERSYLYMAERWPWVKDIREQWPILDPDRTNELHFERGIPIIKRGGFPQPPTIDFMLTEQTNDGLRCRAVAIKPPENKKRHKSQKYLDVQRAWCEENGIAFSVVDSTGDAVLCNTLSFMRNWAVDGYQPTDVVAADFTERFNSQHRSNVSLADLLAPIAKAMRISDAEADALVSYCAWSNRIRLDLKKPVSMGGILYLEEE